MKNTVKGFTLVEVIVVLVVLALLAAIMIPAMTGWIDKAKQKRLIVACRTCVNAAQTLVVEQYGIDMSKAAPDAGEVKTLAGVDGTVSAISLADTTIATLTYADNGGDSVTYLLTPTPHYEFGTSNRMLSDSSSIQAIGQAMWANSSDGGIIDSGATGLGTQTDAALAALQAQFGEGFTLASAGAEAWRFQRSDNCLYWTGYSIDNLPEGTQIPVMRYNNTTGTYTVWKCKVKETAAPAEVSGAAPYNTIDTSGMQFLSSVKDNSNGGQTYEQMMQDYNTLMQTDAYKNLS